MVIRTKNEGDTNNESSKSSWKNNKCVVGVSVLILLAGAGLISSTQALKPWTTTTGMADDVSSSKNKPVNVVPQKVPPPRKPMSKLHQARAPPKPLQSSSNHHSTSLHLIHPRELQLHDYFSDSFLLNRKNFLEMNINRIGIVEDACFEAIGKSRPYARSKMFVDWTHFMVEHLSKWWKTLHILEDPDVSLFEHVVRGLESYWHRALKAAATDSPLHETIAMISFAPYHGRAPGRAEYLTPLSLASTIASIYKVGFGRVLVTGMNDDDEDHVRQAFQLLHNQAHRHAAPLNLTATKIGRTELAYVQMTNRSWTTTKWVKLNIPRGTVLGMQLALSGQMEPAQEAEWLGTSGTDWKYVYLTEPDTLLHTKSWLLPMIQEGLDSGMSFFPHRLQPLPHESDFPSKDWKHHVSPMNEGKFLPGHLHPFSNVTILEEDYSCCDGGGAWIGRLEPFCMGAKEPCGGSMWWSNSLRKQPQNTTDEGLLVHHQKLVHYPMMRLDYGTRLVFASTNHGRRCFPSKTPCSNTTY